MDFVSPLNLKELLNILDSNKEAVLIAGGTDILVKLHKGLIKKPPLIIDISQLKELKYITNNQEHIEIGAGITFSEIIKSPTVQEYFPSLIAASSQIGATQIQNRATIGGNICNASPAADSIPLLMALNSKVVLESLRGQRTIDLYDFIISKSITKLEEGEILKSIQIPMPQKNWHCHFEKLGPRKSLAISVTSLCANLHIEKGIINDIRIFSGCLGPKPNKETQAEDALRGKTFNSKTLEQALKAFEETIAQRLNNRKNGPYKSMAASGLLQACLTKCLEYHQWQKGREKG
jgi:CO/xanthine dehydrogenase FAD-binding subunit